MVIYEVNLRVENEVAEEFAVWIRPHIGEMLLNDGFQSAVWYYEEPERGQQSWSIRYSVSSWKSLQLYFETKAHGMRAQAMDRFGDRFSASRRVLYERESFQ